MYECNLMYKYKLSFLLMQIKYKRINITHVNNNCNATIYYKYPIQYCKSYNIRIVHGIM